MRSQRARFFLLLLVAASPAVAAPERALAICNLIPPAEKLFPSAMGSIDSPIAAPGRTVEIHVLPCDATSARFSETPSNNAVKITFMPPTGMNTAVWVASSDVTPLDCAVGGPCLTLAVKIPDTTSVFPPYGLAGPARIEVTNSGQPAADVFTLNQPATTCDRLPETVFHQFTILPPANPFAGIADGSGTRILATLDGDDNLLVPLDYLAVLPAGVGAPIARFLSGSTDVRARSANPAPIVIPSSDYVRSFTIDGRPLPPLLRVDASGRVLFGTADGAQGILRIARNSAENPQPQDIYDFTDRLFGGKGPIIIDRVADGFSGTSGAAVPLRGLRSSATAVGFARDETLEGADLNGDGDMVDRIVQLVDAGDVTSTNTTQAVVDVHAHGLRVPAIESAGPLVAYLESETEQDADINGDGDRLDAALRVFRLSGMGSPAELTPTSPSLIADGAAVVNGRTLAISNGLVFHRAPEAPAAPVVTTRASQHTNGTEANRSSGSEGGCSAMALSGDGNVVAFESYATNLIDGGTTANSDVFVHDRRTGVTELVGVGNAGERCTVGRNVCVSVSDDGNRVLFFTGCSNLVPGGEAGDLLIRDRGASSTIRVSTMGVDGMGRGNQWSAISGDGKVVAFSNDRPDIVPGKTNGWRDVFVMEVGSNAIEPISIDPAGQFGTRGASDFPSLSRDGRFVSFTSGNDLDGQGPPTLTDIYVRDRCRSNGADVPGCTKKTTRVSVANPGGQGYRSTVSADGRFVAFEHSGCIVPGTCGPPFNAYEVYVRDFLLGFTELVSMTPAGQKLNGPSEEPAISADGRFVAFRSEAPDAVPDDGNGTSDVFVRDRLTGSTERASVRAIGLEGDGPSVEPRISADGRAVAFRSTATNLLASAETGGICANSGLPGTPCSVDPDCPVVMMMSTGPCAADSDVFVRGPAPAVPGGTVLQVFDTNALALHPNATVAAAEVAVAAGRALVRTPDDAALLYEGGDDPPIDLAQPANRIALSDELMAVTEPGIGRDVLAVRDVLGPGAFTVTGLGADAIAAIGTNVVLATVEATEGVPGGLNGDGDTLDRVLRIYRPSGTPQKVESGQAVDDFVASGHLVAFRTPEASQGGHDLNGDGDALDEVMQIYDLATEPPTLISTGQAAIPCTLAGCEPGVAYRIKGDSVAFLTRESDQGGADLDGNGSGADVVVQVFNTKSLSSQIFSFTTDPAAPKAPQPFPDDVLDDPILYQTARETQVGLDLDGDGLVTSRVVTLVVGDQDRDGVFNESVNADDSCVEVSNADQLDSDLDGIGDACDASPYCSSFTPTAPPTAPASAAACQKAIGRAARTLLKTRAKAISRCLKDVASSKLVGNATALCRGSFVGDTDVLPRDAKTATKIAKADATLRKSLAARCPTPTLALLDTCASPSSAPTLDSLVSCLGRTYGDAARTVSQLAYGALGGISDAKKRRCQSTVGDAGLDYLSDLVKTVGACLDRANDGDIPGDVQAGCLGRGDDVGGMVVLPTDPGSQVKIQVARAKLLSRVTLACPGSMLADPSITACGNDPAAVASCLQCSQWRRAVESLRAAYGPQ